MVLQRHEQILYEEYKFSWFYWFNFKYVHAYQVLVPFSTWIDFNKGFWHVAFGMTAKKLKINYVAMMDDLENNINFKKMFDLDFQGQPSRPGT